MLGVTTSNFSAPFALRLLQGLVLPGDQHVALVLPHEGDRGVASAGIEDLHVLIKLADKLLRLLLGRLDGLGLLGIVKLAEIAQFAMQRKSPGRQVIPAGAARRLGMRRNDLHARLDQVVPVVNALGIALANQEENRRHVRTVVVGQLLGAGLPILGQQALLGDGVDVIGQGQGDHRGFRTIDHAAGLLARSAVRRMDRHRLAGRFLPVLGESGVILLIQLPRRIVRHVQQFLAAAWPVEEPQPESSTMPPSKARTAAKERSEATVIFHTS